MLCGKAAFTKDHKAMYRYKLGLIFRKAKLQGAASPSPLSIFFRVPRLIRGAMPLSHFMGGRA